MSRQFAVLVVALLTVAALFVLVPGGPASGSAHASEVPSASHPAVSTISVQTLDQDGYSTDYFYTGLGSAVYFYVTDPSGDQFVNVTVTDQNATRDGLTNPVATFELNVSTGVNDSYSGGIGYVIPISLVYGGWWNVTASAPLGGVTNSSFVVDTYEVESTGTPYDVLPGFPGSVVFGVYASANEAPYTHAMVQLTAVYYDDMTASYMPLSLTNTSFPVGTATGRSSFTVPSNASVYSTIYVTVYANVSSNGNFSYSEYAYVDVEAWDGFSLNINCPTCYGNTAPAGAQVGVTVTTYFETPYSSGNLLSGVQVDFQFWNQTSPIATVPGSPPSELTTNSEGQASILFLATLPTFSKNASAVNHLNISMLETPAVGANATPVWQNYTWYFAVTTAAPAAPNVQITLAHTGYYSGDVFNASWALTATNASTLAGWSGSFYEIEMYTGSYTYQLLAFAPLTGSSGTVQYTIPITMSGTLYLYILASNATTITEGETGVSVSVPTLIVTASEPTYAPGDTVTFNLTAFGSVVAGSTYYYTAVSESTGEVLAQGTTMGSSFAVPIPAMGTPTEIYVRVTAQNPTYGVVATTATYLDETAALELNLGVMSKSSHLDGSYSPGDTVEFAWNFTTVGPVVLPGTWWVYLWSTAGWYGDAPPIAEFQTSSRMGTINYTIPSGTPTGIQAFYIEVNAEPCQANSCYVYGQVSFAVNPSPNTVSNSFLGLAPGGWFLVAIVLVVIAVVLAALLLRKGRGPSAAPASGSGMNPPAPAPSTPPPAEWKEPGASGTADQPPMPSPPPGAQ